MSYHGKSNNRHQPVVVIIPGRPDNPDPASIGQVKVKDPTSHGNNVQESDLQFIPMGHPPGLSSYAMRPPPRGISGRMNSEGGPSQRTLESIYPGINKPNQSMPGNKNLFSSNKDIMDNWNKAEEYFPLPDIKETKDRGALIRQVKEKGKKFSTSLLKGLPVNNSLFALIEQKLPEKKSIETAKEHFSKIITPSMLSKVPGSNMSLGKLFNMLSEKDKKKITKNMPEEVVDAFTSLAFLLPEIESDSSNAYVTDSRVNEIEFILIAIELLSKVKTLADLNEVLMRLLTDSSLFSLDKLGAYEYEIETPFGNVSIAIDSSGNLTFPNNNTNNSSSSTKESFGNFMSSSSTSGGAPSFNIGENLFGDSAKTMLDMFQRAAPEVTKAATELMNKTNKELPAVKRNEIMRVFASGGNPIKTFINNKG